MTPWAIRIKWVYEIDPVECQRCCGRMKIVSFIERRQADVIERILRVTRAKRWSMDCGKVRTNASARVPPDSSERISPVATDPQFVPDREHLESEYRDSHAEATRELQLVLDPDFLQCVPRSATFFTGNTGSTRGACRRPAVNTHARDVQSDSVGIGTKRGTEGVVYQRQAADHVALPNSRHETNT